MEVEVGYCITKLILIIWLSKDLNKTSKTTMFHSKFTIRKISSLNTDSSNSRILESKFGILRQILNLINQGLYNICVIYQWEELISSLNCRGLN